PAMFSSSATRRGGFWESTPARFALKTLTASRPVFRSGWAKRRGERGSFRRRCLNFVWRWKRRLAKRGPQALAMNRRRLHRDKFVLHLQHELVQSGSWTGYERRPVFANPALASSRITSARLSGRSGSFLRKRKS